MSVKIINMFIKYFKILKSSTKLTNLNQRHMDTHRIVFNPGIPLVYQSISLEILFITKLKHSEISFLNKLEATIK